MNPIRGMTECCIVQVGVGTREGMWTIKMGREFWSEFKVEGVRMGESEWLVGRGNLLIKGPLINAFLSEDRKRRQSVYGIGS